MAAAARATNPTDAIVSSPILAGAPSPESRVKKAAGVHFAGEGMDSAAPLAGAPAPAYNFVQKLEEADSLLLNANNSGSKEKARAAYQKASEYLNLNTIEIPAYLHSLTQARYQIGLAFTTSTERNSYTNLGAFSNNSVYESQDSWNSLDKREKIVIYQSLIKNFKNLLLLIPISDKASRTDFQSKMGNCQVMLDALLERTPSTASLPETVAPAAPKLTPPATVLFPAPLVSGSIPSVPPPAATLAGEPAQGYNMEAKFKEADSCSIFEIEKARSIYNEILQRLKDIILATDFLMKARCEIGIAYTYPARIDPEAVKYRDLGKATNDLVYDNITAQTRWIGLYANQKIAIYEGLIKNYKELETYLFREETDRKEISDKIKKCKEQLDVLKKPALSTSPDESVAARLASPSGAPPAAPESTAAAKNSAALAGSSAVPPAPPSVAPPPPPESTAAANHAPRKATLGPAAQGVRFAGDETDSAAPLVNTPSYDMEARFKEAESCLFFEKEKRRSILNAILDHLKGDLQAKDSLMKARCKIALACTYPRDDTERAKYRDLGKTTNDSVYDNIIATKGSGLKNEEKKTIYQGLIQNYRELAIYLLPEEKDRKEIRDKIKNCEELLDALKPTSSIPPAEPVPLASPPVASHATLESSSSPSDGSPSSAPPAPNPSAAAQSSAALARSSAPPVSLLGASLPSPESTAAAKAPSKPAAKPDPRKVTPEPVGGSSTIRTIFALAIIAIAASVASVIIYKRYYAKK